MKTSELTGAALDWAVAKCEGADYFCHNPETYDADLPWESLFNYSTDWAQGGPILEREKLLTCAWGEDQWKAQSFWNESYKAFGHVAMFSSLGPTPLIAAMRCYVASKLGDEVDVPEELV